MITIIWEGGKEYEKMITIIYEIELGKIKEKGLPYLVLMYHGLN